MSTWGLHKTKSDLCLVMTFPAKTEFPYYWVNKHKEYSSNISHTGSDRKYWPLIHETGVKVPASDVIFAVWRFLAVKILLVLSTVMVEKNAKILFKKSASYKTWSTDYITVLKLLSHESVRSTMLWCYHCMQKVSNNQVPLPATIMHDNTN